MGANEMCVNLHTSCLLEMMFNGSIPDLGGLLKILVRRWIRRLKFILKGFEIFLVEVLTERIGRK